MKLIKAVGVIFILFLYGYVYALYKEIEQINYQEPTMKYFIIGFGIFIPIWLLWLKKKTKFFLTFEHEFTHLVVGLIFFKKPTGFEATEEHGGITTMYGNNFIITLAPYFLPTISFILLLLYLIINHQYSNYFFLIFGFVTSYHVFSTCEEFSYSQPDIKETGKIFSTIFLIFANVVIYGYLLAFVIGGFRNGWEFLQSGYSYTLDMIVLMLSKKEIPWE